jgi:regulator of replication initiation timing
MKMKTNTSYMIAILVILVASLSYSQFAIAQSAQSSYTANLTYLTVQLSYPSQVMPGDSVTINLQATAKQNIASLSLAAQVYYSDGTNLHQLASATFNSDYMNNGGSFSKQIQFTVPQDAPRTSLFTTLTEDVKTAYVNYYYYPAYNYSYSPYCYYDQHHYYCQYYYTGYYNYSSPYCNYDQYYGYYCQYYMAYPSYTYATTTDTGLAPLSYIKATTPEYVSLQSQYQSLQQQLAQSQSQNQQLQTQNQQLQQNLQNAQNSNSQKETTISSLNQQLSTSQGINGMLEATTAGLAVIAIVLGALAAYFYRGRNRPQSNVPPNPQQTQPPSKSETQLKP